MLLLLLACDPSTAEESATGGEESVDLPEGDPATVALAGECALDVDRGGFAVTDEIDETNVDGKVADSVLPIAVLEPLVSEGECVVLRRNNPYCDPTCAPGEACTFEGTCVEYPANQDLGTVTIAGLGEPVVMEPVFPGNTYYDTSLVHPAIRPGALVRLAMPGGVYGPANLYGVGVEPLVVSDTVWAVADAQDLVVSWVAPAGAVSRSEVVLSVSIDQHGVTPSSVRCVFPDVGRGTVPGAVVSALVGAGVTGFPNGSLERRTADKAAAGEGCFDFAIRSPRRVDVTVSGHTPCVSDEDCPGTEDCVEELQTCE